MIKKIVLIDGKIEDYLNYKENLLVIDAKEGYSSCQEQLECAQECTNEWTVVTNDLWVWGNNNYNYDHEEMVSKAYLYINANTIPNVQELTDKEIQPYNKLSIMYINGAFEKLNDIKTRGDI